MENKYKTTDNLLLGILTIVFIILKLCGVIDWGWWWVLSPTWIPAFIATTLVVIAKIIKGK